ncbi:hypothetical protein BK138_09380 [Paenibacillus rhizosphaerae]|uniref:Uncharacterized protein n=1 Tax=Paenibacillus rhizosphaerae TaxID=297318 RepID=A0A1R1F3K3_9BACL|nr:hypothetical protein [Paenibacillus rhizosphaerae]OMF58699.1 hypothetical protein BK138_09380 [Paenibacillus rhizosphaerae]
MGFLDFAVSYLAKQFNRPDSSLFLPKLIRSQRNPAYDPWVIEEQQLPYLFSHLKAVLKQATITGISNVSVIGSPSVQNDSIVTAQAQFSKALPAPDSITIKGTLMLIQDTGETLTCDFTASAKGASAETKVTFVENGKRLQATVDELKLTIPKPYVQALHVDVRVLGSDPSWNALLQNKLNEEKHLDIMVGLLCGKLAEKQTLQSFSDLLTNAINSI